MLLLCKQAHFNGKIPQVDIHPNLSKVKSCLYPKRYYPMQSGRFIKSGDKKASKPRPSPQELISHLKLKSKLKH